jgi:hypothetical protein
VCVSGAVSGMPELGLGRPRLPEDAASGGPDSAIVAGKGRGAVEGAGNTLVSFGGGRGYFADVPDGVLLYFLFRRRRYRKRRPSAIMKTTTPAVTPPMRAACGALGGDGEGEPAWVTLK